MPDAEKNSLMNMGFSVWVSICVFACLWLWSSFTKGRRNFQNNLHVIEEGLRRMQADIEMRQREKSIGCVEDVEDISEFLRKFYEEGSKEEKVGVDVWKMLFSSCEYLTLAFVAYILLKLVHACFWLPGYLQKQEITSKTADKEKEATIEEKYGDTNKEVENNLEDAEDKKTV